MAAAEKLADRIDSTVELIGRATSWLALTLALVMGGNVLLRYAFSIGFIWTQELEWHLFVPICLLGMSYALLHGEHVRVDVLFANFKPRTKLAIEVISAALAMILSILVIVFALPYLMQSWSAGEGSSNPGGIPARYIVKAIIPIGFALFFAQSLAQAIRAALAWRRI